MLLKLLNHNLDKCLVTLDFSRRTHPSSLAASVCELQHLVFHQVCTQFFLLYWYKSTDTDATLSAPDQSIASQRRHRVDNLLTGTRFTCFTSTKVQIPTPEELDKLS